MTNGLDQIRAEIITYRRELPRLLADRQEGRYALIQGNQVISLWDTFADAYQAGCERFGLGVPFIAQPVDPRDLTREFPMEFSVPEAG